MKFRITIQKVDCGKYSHTHNIMCETENLELLIKKIRKSIESEIESREQLLAEYINNRQADIYDKLISKTPKGVIDFKAKGKDIGKKEYLINEISFELE